MHIYITGVVKEKPRVLFCCRCDHILGCRHQGKTPTPTPPRRTPDPHRLGQVYKYIALSRGVSLVHGDIITLIAPRARFYIMRSMYRYYNE